MRKGLGLLPALAVVSVALLLAAWLSHYKFTDCKKVGHSTFYCILELSK